MTLDEIKLNDYLNSSEFEDDSSFWKDNLSDIGEYVKFPNLSSSNFAIKEIQSYAIMMRIGILFLR